MKRLGGTVLLFTAVCGLMGGCAQLEAASDRGMQDDAFKKAQEITAARAGEDGTVYSTTDSGAMETFIDQL